MADIEGRLLSVDGEPAMRFLDNGDGTYSPVFATTSVPAPTNFANETGGNLAAIKNDIEAGVAVLPKPVQQTPLPLEAASVLTRTSADIAVSGRGLILVVALANKAGTVTMTPKIQGKTLSGAYYDLWTAAAGLSANGTTVYQISAEALATAGGVTEGKIALIPGVVRVVLTYAGAGGANHFDTTVDLDLTP